VSRAVITWIGGPVLRARMTDSFTVYEAVAVGPRRLLGEVIQLKGDELVAQVYEDTTGLEPGDEVAGTAAGADGPGHRGRCNARHRANAAPAEDTRAARRGGPPGVDRR